MESNVQVPNPVYDPKKTLKKAGVEFLLLAGSTVLVALASLLGQLLVSGEVVALLPPEYLIFAPVLTVIGRALLNWAKHRKMEVEVEVANPGIMVATAPPVIKPVDQSFQEKVERVRRELHDSVQQAAKSKAEELRHRLRMGRL